MSSITKEQILAGLKKVGPCSPGALAAHLGVDYSRSYMKKLVANMTGDNEIKAIGSRKSRRIALPDQEFTDTEAHQPQRTPKKGKKAKKARKAKTPAAPAERIAERFIPTVDAQRRLHIINSGAPVSYDEAQTLAIAELLGAHYESA